MNLQPLSSSSTLPALDASSQESSASDSVETAVVRGSAMNPQKPENVLDSMPAKATAETKVDTSDHGANCVCKDCRVKKIGKEVFFPIYDLIYLFEI